MARHTLFAYVDGSDLDEVASEIETALEALVASSSWTLERPWVVNQKHERDPSSSADDLAQWDLGLNLDLPEVGTEAPHWLEDVEQVARIAGQVVASSGRTFVVGIGDNNAGVSEDLVDIEDSDPDLAKLRALIGLGSQS